MRLPLVVACLIGCLALAAGNPSSYPARTNMTAEVPSTGAIFSLYSDMQTYLGSAASCMNSNASTLASLVSAEEMAAVSDMAVAFWASSAGQAYLSAPVSPPAQPGQPGSVGFWNASLFNGCVWIGMSNMNEPGHDTYAANINSTSSLGFVDNAPMHAYIANMRSGSAQSPVQVSGWRFYGRQPPVRNTTGGVDTFATCAMLCANWSTLQSGFGYTPIVMAGCTTIALPYVCKYNPTAAVEDAASSSHSSGSSGHRALMGGAAAAASSDEEQFTQIAVPAHNTHGASPWPPIGDRVNSSIVSPAMCYPGGLYDYCVFPDTEKHTQADWMYICWDAGLEPLDIDSYSTLVTVLAAGPNTTAMPPGSNVQFVHTQAFIDANHPTVASNLYTDNLFLQGFVAGHAMPPPNLPGGRVTSVPAFNATGPSRQPQPGWPYLTPLTTGTSCGPSGNGFGCAVAVYYVAGRPAGLTAISANTLAHGMCTRKRHAPQPRPSDGANPVVQVVFRLPISDNVTLAILQDPVHYQTQVKEFVEMLAWEAVPAALPGVAAEDVIIPAGPTTVFSYVPGMEDAGDHSSDSGSSSGGGHRKLHGGAPAPSSSSSDDGHGASTPVDNGLTTKIGVMLQITLPYTVNTTALINAYLANIMNQTDTVLSPQFMQKYHIENSSAFVSLMSGNLDASPPDSDENLAVAVGLGVGMGVPVFIAACVGLWWFFKDANASSQGYQKSKDSDEVEAEEGDEEAAPAKGK